MIAFLLVISFILHALSLFVIILLYLQLSKVKETEKHQQQMAEEMEQTFSAYLLEWKEENERFLKELSDMLTNRTKADRKQSPSKANATSTKEEALPDYFPNVDDVKDIVDIRHQAMPSLVEEAWQLFEQGKTIEEIAKILKKGKTEIELLLKFRQK
jgi:DNA-directed RNA polymerase specialized sigma54-like protein